MPQDPLILATVIGVAVLAVAGVLFVHLRVRRDLAQARAQLAQARQAQEHLSRETNVRDQRLREAERQIHEAVERQALEAAEAVREARGHYEQMCAETAYLLDKRIPALVSHLRSPHVVVPGLRDATLAGTDVDRLHRGILDALARAIREEGERVDEAAQAVVRGAMSRVQTQALRAQDLLADVQRRYSGDEHTALLREVLGLDMFNELIIRRVQATGIACGATPGLSRDDTYLVDLVVGAISRVENFEQRVEGPANHLRRRVGVAARAAEPILFVTSELLANAVHHSHGTLKVSIAVHETNTGAAIVIDDAGVGLNEEQFARASRLLNGTQPVRLVDLGNPPHTGWAAIGRQVAHYGMQVTVKKSAFGGVQAVVGIPNGLLVEMPEHSRPSVLAPEPVRAVAATSLRREPAATPSRAAAPEARPVSVPATSAAPATVAGPGSAATVAGTAPGAGPVADPGPVAAPGSVAGHDGQARPDGAEPLPGLPQRRRQTPRATPARAARPAAGAPGRGADRALTTPEEAQRRWGDFQTGAEAGRREAIPSQPHDITEGN
ncbi:ATP-binding protein [Nonomuraea rhodomycinica]|uniref:histidine kinase n=1 Tax=Nonomuraea rhodomycinica TaxID=1712872 RepID=A0A7Y6IR69_9ACTN|nr:histidine kinase [Nonomuraea rhodomycinica]NUW42591.1 histidine kinase [Nonomuraea rhodomycinica]